MVHLVQGRELEPGGGCKGGVGQVGGARGEGGGQV